MDIAQLAGPSGIFSRAQARAFGVEDVVLRGWIRSGAVMRMMRGWYAVSLPDDVWQAHRLRCLAVARSHPGSLAISHYSAAVWHGLPIDDADAQVVQAMRRSGHGRRTPNLVLHEPAPADPLGGTGEPNDSAAVPPDPARAAAARWPARPIELAPAPAAGKMPELPYPVPVASPALAIMQTGLTGGPLGALMAADAALHRGVVREKELQFELARFRRVPGIAQVRAALALCDPKCESPAETKLRWVLVGLGWAFRTQVAITTEGCSYRVDVELDAAPVVIEVDGAVKYAGGVDQGRRVVLLEKQREDRIRRTGREVVRFMMHELTPQIVDARVRAAIALSRSRGQAARHAG